MTADVYVRRLAAFCSSMHATPGELAAKSERELEYLVKEKPARAVFWQHHFCMALINPTAQGNQLTSQ